MMYYVGGDDIEIDGGGHFPNKCNIREYQPSRQKRDTVRNAIEIPKVYEISYIC